MCPASAHSSAIGDSGAGCSSSRRMPQAWLLPATVQREPKIPQLLAQCLEFGDAHLDVMQVLVDQPVGGAAIRLGTVAQRQQGTDFLLGHVQRAAVTDERQALDMRQGVLPIVAFATRGLGQQAFALVVADGLHQATGSLRQLTDLHANPPPIADAATRIGSTA